MNIHTFKKLYNEKNPEHHFFDPETLKFFGDSLDRMKVREAKDPREGHEGEPAYILTSRQRRPELYEGEEERTYIFTGEGIHYEGTPDSYDTTKGTPKKLADIFVAIL